MNLGRVLFVSTSTTTGGAEKTLFSLATLLDHAKFPVAGVVSLKPAGAYAQRLSAAGIPVTTLELQGYPWPAHLRRLVELIDANNPDIVHAFMYQAIQLCRLAKSRTKKKFQLVSSPRVNYRTRSWLTLALDKSLKGADDLLIAESDASRRFLTGKLGYPTAKVSVVYNGVDVASWPRSPHDRKRLRAGLGMIDEEVLIGAAGRLDAQKGHEYLVQALALLAKKSPVRCAILGEGPRRPLLESLIRRHKLERKVVLLGERPDLVAWLSAFDVFALPSLWEGLPNALLEAMALGLPVAASAVDGVGEAVQDGVSGLLVPPKDAAALARCLGELASKAGLRESLGAAARRAVSEKFTLPRMLYGYEQAYQDVLSAYMNISS